MIVHFIPRCRKHVLILDISDFGGEENGFMAIPIHLFVWVNIDKHVHYNSSPVQFIYTLLHALFFLYTLSNELLYLLIGSAESF